LHLKSCNISRGLGCIFSGGSCDPAVYLLQSSNYNATVWGKVIVTSTASNLALQNYILLLLVPDKDLASKQRQRGKNEAADPARDKILSV